MPMIQGAWTRERSRVWELLGKKKLAVAGDGRCDSSGYSAKYGTYTMMDTASQLIIDFELVQVTQASSVGMEKLGFQTLTHRLQTAKLKIATIITDGSPQVKALMKKTYANVNYQFDIWPFVKNVSKKIRKTSKKKGCQILLECLPQISTISGEVLRPATVMLFFCGKNGRLCLSISIKHQCVTVCSHFIGHVRIRRRPPTCSAATGPRNS